jgi:flavin-dependent dehydrogenase
MMAAPAGHPSSVVVIAGASFAGLAVAREVPGRAVLIDPEDVGEGQMSACGAPVGILASLGASEAVQQYHDALVIHTPGRETRWRVPEPFCTFDYRACCRAALRGTGARVIRAAVRGRQGDAVVTSAGDVAGRVLVDCTGWRSALVGRDGPDRHPGYLGFGLEAEVPSAFPPGLHFYFWPEIVPDGYAWAFPAGRTTRVGLLSYRGRTRLGPGLAALLARLNLPPGPLHGGFLRGGLREPVVEGVFVVGDAAGQCLPFTGEGIRSAVWAGRLCGRLIREALDGGGALEEAHACYRAFVLRQRRRYRALVWATGAALILPARLLGLLAAWVGRPGPLRVFMTYYLEMFADETRTDGSRVGHAVGGRSSAARSSEVPTRE